VVERRSQGEKKAREMEAKEWDAAEKERREREKEEFEYAFKREQRLAKESLQDENPAPLGRRIHGCLVLNTPLLCKLKLYVI
jgi:hypothetical protein